MQHLQHLELTQLTSQHAKQCLEIMQSAFVYPWRRIDDLFHNSCYEVWGVTHTQQLVAFVGVSLVLPEVEILTCAVLPQFQQQGIGKFMFETLLHNLRSQGIKRSFLDVNTTNTAAINLYLRLGFHRIDTRKNYYKNPDGSRDDAWVMIKELN